MIHDESMRILCHTNSLCIAAIRHAVLNHHLYTYYHDEDGELLQLEDLLPSPIDRLGAGPEALYLRSVLLDELELALDELPEEQREVFVAHELEGRSFKELSAESGVNVNTLLARKRYAVLRLRERLQNIHEEFLRK